MPSFRAWTEDFEQGQKSVSNINRVVLISLPSFLNVLSECQDGSIRRAQKHLGDDLLKSSNLVITLPEEFLARGMSSTQEMLRSAMDSAVYRGKPDSWWLPRTVAIPLKFFGTYVSKTWGFLRLTSRAQKNIFCRPQSCKNDSTAIARNGRHSLLHPGQRRWAAWICTSKQIWRFDGCNARRTTKVDYWTLVDLLRGREAIRCDWNNEATKNEHETISRLKSPLVV